MSAAQQARRDEIAELGLEIDPTRPTEKQLEFILNLVSRLKRKGFRYPLPPRPMTRKQAGEYIADLRRALDPNDTEVTKTSRPRKLTLEEMRALAVAAH